VEPIDRHRQEVLRNLERWHAKSALRKAYGQLHALIATQLSSVSPGLSVELGSGIGNIRDVIPDCICTDLFAHPWIDQVENAYALSFADASVANLILFDVFHHLRYPGTALREFRRALAPGGRVIILEPCISSLGWFAYGICHREDVAIRKPIEWEAPDDWSPNQVDYYAAQGNATRIFLRAAYAPRLRDWRMVVVRRYAAISYVFSGGYAGPQLYPAAAYPFMRAVDSLCDLAPALFATRLLVVLERT
jgi:SAM-dependent methyltransferase